MTPLIGGLFGLALLALWVFSIFDVISTDEVRIRNVSKLVWLLIVIFVPTIGSIAWLLLGRPEGAGLKIGDTSSYKPPRRQLAPDDDPRFLARIDNEARRLRKWEEDLKRREDEMRRRDEGDQGTT